MNRTDRLLAIIWLLRTRQKIKAEELAEIFGVTVRSIYRDVQALMQANVPVISLPGPDGGYSLMKEYSVTPITFSDPEIAALYLGANFLNATRLGPFEKAIRSAIDKIGRVLPEAQVRRLQTLQRAILSEIGVRAMDECEVGYFQTLEGAIVDSCTLQAQYKAQDGEVSERAIDPYGLVFQAGHWYAVAYCHLRQGMRMFRLDRFIALERTDRRFQRPADFSVEAYSFRAWDEQELQRGPWQQVRLRCTPGWSSYFEAHDYFRRCKPRRTGDDLLMDLPQGGLHSLVRLVMEARGGICVLEPADLREKISGYARELLSAHSEQMIAARAHH